MAKKELNYQKWRQKHLASLAGCRALVTGGNSGIGFEAARGLLALSANVTLCCRNAARAQRAVAALQDEFPNARVDFMILDLASAASIDAFAENVAKRGEKIDILLHFAGVYYPKEPQTADGLPMTVGVNYRGTLRLTEALLPVLSDTARVVFTSSLVDRFGKPGGGDGNEGYGAYAESKLRLSAYALQKARERGEKGPAFITTHPGITATDLLSPAKTSHKPLFSRLGHAFLYIFTHSPEKASLCALLGAAGRAENGACIGPRGLFGISGYPHFTRFAPSVRKLTHEQKANETYTEEKHV